MADRYRIELSGRLDESWASWLGNFKVEQTESDQTVLTGEVVDQAMLHGLLGRIRDLGIPILLIQRLDSPQRNL